jgi:hypothetical protein
MGYLTVVVIHNDAYDAFSKNPKLLGEKICEAIRKCDHKPQDIPFENYGGYLQVLPSRHADDHTVYVNCGNGVTEVLPYSTGFRELIQRCPDFAKKIVSILCEYGKMAKKDIAKYVPETPKKAKK